jgi:large subunit ribosomal protein L35
MLFGSALFGAWSTRSELASIREAHRKGSKMPKMKTKSAAKKRFKITGTGKVLSAAAGKRHGMIKRSNKFIRDARGTMVLAEPDARKVVKNFLPNGGGL